MGFTLNDELIRNTHGFYLKNSGGDFTRFNANPVMLFNHEYDKVIGRWENLRVEENLLIADEVFDVDDPESLKIKNKVDRNFLKGASLGIYPLDAEVELRDGKEELVVTRWELLEGSIVSVPSNGNAIRLYGVDGEIMEVQELKLMAKKTTQPNFLNNMKIETIAVMIGLAADAKEDQVMETLSAIIAKNNDNAKQLTAKDKEIQDLKAVVEEHKQSKVKSLIDSAIADKKIDESLRATYTKLANTDFAEAKKALDAIKGVGRAVETLGQETVPDGEKDWDFHKYVREGKAEHLKANNLNRFKELYKKAFNRDYKS